MKPKAVSGAGLRGDRFLSPWKTLLRVPGSLGFPKLALGMESVRRRASGGPVLSETPVPWGQAVVLSEKLDLPGRGGARVSGPEGILMEALTLEQSLSVGEGAA